MPHFQLVTNIPQNKIPADFPRKMCQKVADVLGKPVEYCVTTVIGGLSMSFGATNDTCGQAILGSIGALGLEVQTKISPILFDFVEKELGLKRDRLYIRYDDVPPHCVAWNGTTFHQLMGLDK